MSASLRSLIFIGVDPGTTADVVAFLTSEVGNGGGVVARQHLLDDLTIIGGGLNGEEAAMDGVYQSEALTQRMKNRVSYEKLLRKGDKKLLGMSYWFSNPCDKYSEITHFIL